MKKSKPKRSVIIKINKLINEARIEIQEADDFLKDLENFLGDYKKTGRIPLEWMPFLSKNKMI